MEISSWVQERERKPRHRRDGDVPSPAATLPARKFSPDSEPHLLARRQLARRVADAPVVLVTAGPGYGKTALLNQIARDGEAPCAWLSFDPADHSAERFLAGLFTAIERAGLNHDARATTPDENLHARADGFLSALAASPDSVRIVLDDFQHVEANEEIVAIVEYLLRYLPNNVQVLIGSRVRPWIPAIERLASQGHLRELTSADLHFSREETRRLIVDQYRLTVGETDLDVLDRALEGWPIALQVWRQVVTTNRAASLNDSTAVLGRVFQRLGNFLQTEIFARQSPAIQTFLLESSILQTLDDKAGDAILGRSDSGLLIDHLERHNLLIVRDGGGNRRYHRVFHEFLRERFARHGRRRRELALSASNYFDARADHAAAIERLLDVGEWSIAANRLQNIAEGATALGSNDRFLGWLKKIPSSVLDLYPRLLISWAEQLDQMGETSEARQVFLRAARLAGREPERQLAALTWSARGLTLIGSHLAGGQVESLIALYEAVLAGLKGDAPERPIVLGVLALARLAGGRPAASDEALEAALGGAVQVGGNRRVELEVQLHAAAPIYFFRGQFSDALRVSERARALAQDLARPADRCLGSLRAAEALVQLGRWADAGPYLDEALATARRQRYRLLQVEAFRILGDAQLAERPDREGGALGHYQAGLGLLRPAQMTDRATETRMILAVANYHRRVGQRMEAVRQAQVAYDNLDSPQSIEEILVEPRVHVALGAALVDVDPTGAKELFRHGTRLAERYGDQAMRSQAALWLATLAMRDGSGPFSASLQAALRADHALLVNPDLGVLLLVEAVRHGEGVDALSNLVVRGGRSAVPSIVPLIDHPAPEVRRQAIELLGKIGDVRVRRQLLRAYKDSDPAIRSAARATLDMLGQPDPPVLRVQFLGRFVVLRDGVAITDGEWKTRKVKSLFKYLVLHPGQFVSQERLMELLWPDANPSAASMNLRTTITSLRRALEPYLEGKASHFIVHQSEGIQFNTAVAYSVDVNEFAEQYRTGIAAADRGIWDSAMVHYQTADQLYAGDFLEEDLYEDWTAVERESFREMHNDLLLRMADINVRQEHFVDAISLCQRVLTLDGSREDVHRRLMAYYAQAGRPVQAIRQFQLCSRILRKEYGVDPSNQTNELFDRIRAEMRGDGKRSP